MEASTSFSMFLSGFLVKTAALFFFKIMHLLSEMQTSVITGLLLVSVICSTFMLFGESDLKRFVAVGTIQEMGFAMLLLVLTKSENSSVSGNSLLVHSLVSITMFWVSDQIYCRLGHRSLNGTGGLWYVAPKTTIIAFFIFFIIRGLPFMYRYNIEFQSFEAVSAFSLEIAAIFIFVLACVGNLAILYRVFKLFFGAPNRKLMPYETQISNLVVPLVPICAMLYFPFA